VHFIHEDSGKEIGQAIATWLAGRACATLKVEVGGERGRALRLVARPPGGRRVSRRWATLNWKHGCQDSVRPRWARGAWSALSRAAIGRSPPSSPDCDRPALLHPPAQIDDAPPPILSTARSGAAGTTTFNAAI
jgi:hypothetical protein